MDLGRVLMATEEVDLIMATSGHAQDSRGHAHHLLAEDMEDLVAHHLAVADHHLAEEDMEDYLLRAQEEALHQVVADHRLEVLL